MSENDESKKFLPEDNLHSEPRVVEVPTDPKSPYPDRIPSGYDPMGEIYLRGRAFRGLAGGRIPWWVLISGWIIFGGSAVLMLMLLISAIASASFSALPALLFIAIPIAIPLIILCRGTTAKVSIEKHKSGRR